MKNSSSNFNKNNNIYVQRSTSVVSSKIDTQKVVNPVSKKDWKSGTETLKEIFSAKDEEIEYWKSMCDQQEIQISQLEIISEQKNEFENECFQLRQAMSQKEYENEQLKRSSNDQNRLKDQKINELEEKCANLAVENERLRQMLGSKNNDLEMIKRSHQQQDHQINELRKLEPLCQEKDKQIMILVQSIEEWKTRFQKQERIIEELRRFQDLCKEYENKIGQFTQELERLNMVIRNMHQEQENYRNRINEFELQVSQMRSFEARIKEYENRVLVLTQEIQRLNEALNIKNGEIIDLKDKNKKLEINVMHLKQFEERCREMEQSMRQLSQILQDEKIKYSNLERQYEQLKQLEIKLREYENKIILLTQEIDRLNQVISIKIQEIDQFRIRISQYESQLIKYQNIEQKMIEYENRLMSFSQEIERLKCLLDQKAKDSDEWRNKCQMLDANCRNYEAQIRALNQRILELTQQLELLSRQLQDQCAENQEHKVKRSKNQKEIQDWEAKVVLLTNEIDRLRLVLQKRDEEIQQWQMRYQKLEMSLSEFNMLREKNRVLNMEVDRLNQELTELETENCCLKQSIVNINDLQVRIHDLLMLCVQLFTEIECLRSRVIQSKKQVEEMRRSSLAGYRN